jgi:hypothetical protein
MNKYRIIFIHNFFKKIKIGLIKYDINNLTLLIDKLLKTPLLKEYKILKILYYILQLLFDLILNMNMTLIINKFLTLN